MKRKVQQRGATDWNDHRGDFETCPSCHRKTWVKLWQKMAHTLYLEPRHIKADSVAVVSKCPICGADSWVHEPMSSFGRYLTMWPKTWQKAVQKHEAKVKLQALRDWGAGICWKCKKLESGTVEYHAWRQCARGSGPAERQCEVFEELKRK